jgi:hypothetical protein
MEPASGKLHVNICNGKYSAAGYKVNQIDVVQINLKPTKKNREEGGSFVPPVI